MGIGRGEVEGEDDDIVQYEAGKLDNNRVFAMYCLKRKTCVAPKGVLNEKYVLPREWLNKANTLKC